jgi:glycosyltransferase involved in cell wall biosynthesis
MRFSVIIPAFNRGYILAEAIESVLAQTYPDFEAIIVDDGSTDNTAQVASNTGDSRVRVIRRAKNAGVAAARNLGMDQAQGELISFLDSDDLWNPDKLAVESAFLDKHAEVDAAFTDVSKIHGELRIHSIARTCPVFHEFLNGASSKCGIVVPRRTMYLSMLQEMPIKNSGHDVSTKIAASRLEISGKLEIGRGLGISVAICAGAQLRLH